MPPTPSPTLTEQQSKVLAFIKANRRRRRISPTYSEIADHLHISKPTSHEHVEELIRKGFVEKDAFRARGLRLTSRAERLLRERITGLQDLSTAWSMASETDRRNFLSEVVGLSPKVAGRYAHGGVEVTL